MRHRRRRRQALVCRGCAQGYSCGERGGLAAAPATPLIRYADWCVCAVTIISSPTLLCLTPPPLPPFPFSQRPTPKQHPPLAPWTWHALVLRLLRLHWRRLMSEWDAILMAALCVHGVHSTDTAFLASLCPRTAAGSSCCTVLFFACAIITALAGLNCRHLFCRLGVTASAFLSIGRYGARLPHDRSAPVCTLPLLCPPAHSLVA